eukprot:jgi/Tetstr1/424162/TSEL_014768.t1
MASVSTFHAAAGTDDASWEDMMLPRRAREPPPVPCGPPLRYYPTTVSADDLLSVSDGLKLNGPLTNARQCEANSNDTPAAQGVYIFISLAEAQNETDRGFDVAFVCTCHS